MVTRTQRVAAEGANREYSTDAGVCTLEPPPLGKIACLDGRLPTTAQATPMGSARRLVTDPEATPSEGVAPGRESIYRSLDTARVVQAGGAHRLAAATNALDNSVFLGVAIERMSDEIAWF